MQADDPLVGRLLDRRYRLTGLLARGGMATVYRALDERLERPVAVKVMHRGLADDPDFVARFTREARSAARLSAPEVVAVYDQGRDEQTGAAYLVMEHVEGRDLRALLRDRGVLSPARALSLLEPVLRALAAAHRAGIVHRDVKPENVLLGDDGRVKVADFGLARAVQTSELTSTTGLLIGTVAYLAPEQIERGTADARTDVYAAGVVLWEALTGAPPYAADTPMQVAYRHVHEDVPAPSTVVGGIPPALDDLVVRATRRDPGLRPPDAGAFLAEVRALRMQYYEYVSAGDGPNVVVIEDTDWPHCIGGFWGEMQVAQHKGLGVAGTLTNGVLRDLGMLDPNYQVIAGSVGPSHAFVHVTELDVPVTVFGMAVRPGDLIHADRHGAVVIPAQHIEKMPAAIDIVVRKEQPVLKAARAPGFTVEKLRAAWLEADAIK